ncbi:hypothetical protein LTR10_016458 [Elasticomyces elasticus]|uniref:Zn(2)-C6 fungal-type domain-containing protein n=1 Tax=Exophiala sideris TaxID=1016849 RepID=A0ABR0JDG1_9EURO|nr:hypothetical protein LTR10_016458 [Elasticomyces elasticus]KAK5031154.1 hypothetical protein LTS07_004889 [Exophiala sideris]KAK5038875.1 hypothetical protein LTR13_003906 [Exophiala sideris]KAK5060759.1 hypothetical protein LTR69_005358 [Exophiala sideris]KAK5183671.1 hypothetical protein LTR44_003953 [Eurotiomycetes sp. CCFEE 6388]
MDLPPAMTSEQSSSLKRPRSPTDNPLLPASKVPKTATNHLQINYLARQNQDTIPLVTVNDKLPEIARLLNEYDGVIQRHESMAGNLGACPLGPILLKRFERLFEGPPKVLKSNGRDPGITWLDVVEFAQNNPKQFNLERMRNGIRVCQFYTRQCRVEISEEDYVLIASGMPQKLIPPQPILEDEEKELGVMDLLDRNLGQVIQLADQVSGRARQLIHKMKNRRTAILSRREQEAEAIRRNTIRSDGSPMSLVDTNGVTNAQPVSSIEASQSPPVGFTAVNLRHSGGREHTTRASIPGEALRNQPEERYSSSNVTIINGKSIKDASPSVRAEMMKEFLIPGEREAAMTEDNMRSSSMSRARTSAMHETLPEQPRADSIEHSGGSASKQNQPTVAIPNTPASLMPHSKPSTLDRDDGGPFKTEMVRRMDSMWKGDRVVPPCDRCRRLHMDCLKNLTACMGCTKKHAKCSWKEVKAEELQTTGSVAAPDNETATATTASENLPPMSAGSTIEVNRPSDEALHSASIARASLDLTGDLPDTPSKDVGGYEVESRRKSESASIMNSTARFDVRPPPLVQQIQHAAKDRSPREGGFFRGNERARDDEDDEGDRLQALAARVYRSASQSGHRV